MTAVLLALTLSAAAVLAETPSEIVGKAAQRMLKANRKRDDYLYKVKTVTREMDSADNVKKTEETQKEVMVFAGEQVERTIEKNGKPLPEGEAKKEQAKVDRAAAEAAKLTPEEVQARLEKRDHEFAKSNGWLTELPAAFHFTLLGERDLNGAPVYIIKGVPDPAYRGKDAHMFRCVEGTLYIEKQNYTLVQMDGVFLQDCSFGMFLAKVDQGSKLHFERVLVNNEVWLPKQIKVSGEGRALFIKFNAESDVEYSDYKKFTTDSRLVSTDNPQ